VHELQAYTLQQQQESQQLWQHEKQKQKQQVAGFILAYRQQAHHPVLSASPSLIRPVFSVHTRMCRE